ncbi:MAG: hypothetical protein FP831_03155 [Anaerolineae bacterium]|nr:hypothetical protein [Anaerolineae bacterium]
MLGTILAIGSKENMIIIIVPEIFLFGLFFRKPFKRNIFPIIMISFSLLMTLWIVLTLFIRIKTNGADFYGNSIGIHERLIFLGEYFAENYLLIMFLGIILITGIIGLNSTRIKTLKFRFLTLIFGIIGIIFLIVSQQYFYSGSIWGRYNIPYALFLPFMISLVANFIQNLPYNYNKVLSNLTTVSIGVVIIFFFIHPQNVILLRKISNEYAIITEQFASNLKDIKYFSSTNTDSALVFYGNKPGDDYERIISYIRFLRGDQHLNNIYIYRDPPLDYQSSFIRLDASLEKQLALWSESGKLDDGIKPISEYYNNPDDCLLISMAETHPQEITCESVIIVH